MTKPTLSQQVLSLLRAELTCATCSPGPEEGEESFLHSVQDPLPPVFLWLSHLEPQLSDQLYEAFRDHQARIATLPIAEVGTQLNEVLEEWLALLSSQTQGSKKNIWTS